MNTFSPEEGSSSSVTKPVSSWGLNAMGLGYKREELQPSPVDVYWGPFSGIWDAAGVSHRGGTQTEFLTSRNPWPPEIPATRILCCLAQSRVPWKRMSMYVYESAGLCTDTTFQPTLPLFLYPPKDPIFAFCQDKTRSDWIFLFNPQSPTSLTHGVSWWLILALLDSSQFDNLMTS